MRATRLVVAYATLMLLAGGAQAADHITIGYSTTLTGPLAVEGEQMVNAFSLALEHLDNKLGGLPATLVIADDQAKPQVGVQNAHRLLERDKADLLAGMLLSNVTEAILNAVLPEGAAVIASGGVPAPYAGKDCSRNFISTFWNTDTPYEQIGLYLKRQGIKRPYVIGLNVQPGRDALNGFKLGMGGEMAGETYTRVDQSEFASELTDIRRVAPDAVVWFNPGGTGIAFLKQYVQAGLINSVPLYGMTIQTDESKFPALGDAAIGVKSVGNWSPELDNDSNRHFVAAYRAKYGRLPTTLGAMAYDNALLIDAAVRAVGGDLSDKAKLVAAARRADFASVRGKIRFNNNNVPIQNFYLNVVEKGPDGVLRNKLAATVASEVSDPHAKDCPLTW